MQVVRVRRREHFEGVRSRPKESRAHEPLLDARRHRAARARMAQTPAQPDSVSNSGQGRALPYSTIPPAPASSRSLSRVRFRKSLLHLASASTPLRATRTMDACLARFAPGHAVPALADENFNAAAAGLAPSASTMPGMFALPATDVSPGATPLRMLVEMQERLTQPSRPARTLSLAVHGRGLVESRRPHQAEPRHHDACIPLQGRHHRCGGLARHRRQVSAPARLCGA